MALALPVTAQKHSASESQLVAAVRQGDDRAFEELFSRYRSRITAYVLGMLRDHARAEDVTQEVFLNALRRLRDSERPIAFKPWIYEIARNACIDEFRRSRRTSEIISLNAGDESPSGDDNLVSKQLTPDAAIENKQRLEALRGAFRGLSENHHRILVMRELEGLSYREIADRMGMSRPMVESALFRARRRLGEEYEELSTGRRCQQVCEVVDRAGGGRIRVLGVRARRQVALHLSHCDDCRRHARLAGADEALFRAPTFADKAAALLPFGWLGRHFGGRLAKTAASQYVGSTGSAAILGRVAAAVLAIAAAGGGGYAGVSLSTGKATVHHASAVIQRNGTGAAGAAGKPQGAGSQATWSPIAITGLVGHPRSGGRTGSVVAGTSAPHGAGAPTSPNGAGTSSGGGGTATSARAGSPAAASPTTSHRGPIASSPASGVVRNIAAPIASHVPAGVKSTAGSVVSGATNTAKSATSAVQAPKPQQVLSSTQQAAGGAVNGATQTVHKLLP